MINGDYIMVINVIIYSPVVKHGWEIPERNGEVNGKIIEL
jgi:hypothetical protein